MEGKIIITSDSTCDLSPALLEENHISLARLSVILGDTTYRDGEGIEPQTIFDFVEKTGDLPKTAAPSLEDYLHFFRSFTDKGNTVIHFNISSKASGSHGFAVAAQKEIGEDKVYVVDSYALSTGQGLLVMKACDLVKEGKSAKEIYDAVMSLRDKVNTSFIPDTLLYLFKGGRCSRLSFFGAKVLNIHPYIDMKDGELYPKKKYIGNMSRCLKNYVKDLVAEYPSYDDTRCFITHSSAEPELVESVRKMVEENFRFKEIIETVEGSIITSHCGKNTIGVLFITK